MTIKEIISSAGRSHHTIVITARERNGSKETREVEPYSYRFRKGHRLFYCYDISKRGTRSFVVSRIIAVAETNNTFRPRWRIEV